MLSGLAVLLAVAAACCYAVAACWQQAAVHTAAGGGGLRWAQWARVLRAPRWISGFGLIAAGAALHASALSLAPLVVVQPIGVLAIALTTVLATRSAGHRLSRPTQLGVAASTLGVGLFVVLAATSPPATTVQAGVDTRASLLAGLLVVALGAVGAVGRGRVRCLAFAATAGVAYGLVSVLVHTTATGVEAGGIGQIHLIAVSGVAVALLVGGWFVQQAYASGPPQVAVACQTVIDPMLGVGIGIGLLREAAHLTSSTAVGLVLCAALAITGVIVLARQPSPPATAHSVSQTGPDPSTLERL